MLTKEERELVIKIYGKEKNCAKIARMFGVHRSTIRHLVHQMEETGSVEPQTFKRGRKPSLSEQDIRRIDELIQKQPDITLPEIRETLNLPVTTETIRQKVIGLGYTYKKKSLHAEERERPRRTKET